MLRQKLFYQNYYSVIINSCRNYLSHEFKSTAKEGYHSLFVSKITSNDDKSKDDGALDIAKQFSLLRSKKLAPAALDSAGFAVINYFINQQSGHSQDLVAIIANRLEYGVFLTQFSACYLLDYYLEAEDFAAAAHVAIEASLQELLNNELVVALALKACFAYLKTCPKVEIEVPKVEEKGKKKDEKKVRVKFLRNPVDFDMGSSKLTKQSFLQTLQRLTAKVQENRDIHFACQIITLLLVEKSENSIFKLKVNNKLPADLLQLCKEVAKGNNAEIEQALSEIQEDQISINDILNEYVKQKANKAQPELIKMQQNDYNEWVAQHARDLEVERQEKLNLERAADIDVIVGDIKTQRQKLWFFEEEEKLDLEIYNKRPKYKKRWFGKIKKPKVIDENYIPPEIRN